MHELSALDTTVSICIGESLMLVFSKPLEGVGDGDLLRHSDDSEKQGDSARKKMHYQKRITVKNICIVQKKKSMIGKNQNK